MFLELSKIVKSYVRCLIWAYLNNVLFEKACLEPYLEQRKLSKRHKIGRQASSVPKSKTNNIVVNKINNF